MAVASAYLMRIAKPSDSLDDIADGIYQFADALVKPSCGTPPEFPGMTHHWPNFHQSLSKRLQTSLKNRKIDSFEELLTRVFSPAEFRELNPKLEAIGLKFKS